MLRKILDGVQAGIAVSLGGSVFLACENKIVGSVLFCVALITICYRGYSLYTGKIGFIPEKHGKEEISVLLLGLLGNVIGTFLCGLLLKVAMTNLADAAFALCTAKLTQTLFGTFVRALFCGILMYIAVSIFRDRKSIVGILFCIPVFILSGFEHSIADMFYFAVSGIVSLRAFTFILMVILGNTVGGMLLPVLSMVGSGEKENA